MAGRGIRPNVMGCRRITISKPAVQPFFVEADIAAMCQSVAPLQPAVAVAAAAVADDVPVSTPVGADSDSEDDFPTPPPPKEPYVSAVQCVQVHDDAAADGLPLVLPLPQVPLLQHGSKQEALDAARARIPVFEAVAVHFYGPIGVDVTAVVGGKDGIGQIRRHMTELTDARTTSVPMPHICPEFALVKPATPAVCSAMLGLVVGSAFRSKTVTDTHTCYMVQDGATDCVWAVSACSALDSFLFAALDGPVVRAAFGVHGKKTVLLTDKPCDFGIVPEVVQLLVSWVVVTLNAKKVKFQFRVTGPCLGYVDFMTARIKAYTASLGRVRNAGSSWQVMDRKLLADCDEEAGGGDRRRRKEKKTKRDVQKPVMKKSKKRSAADDAFDCSTVGVASEAVRLKRYCREVNIVTLIGILVGEKVSLRL